MNDTMPPSTSTALRVAKEAFAAMDAESACLRTGADYDRAENCYVVAYMGQTARVDASTCQTRWEFPRRVSHMDSMVVWHYLMHADGARPAGELLSVFDAAPSSSHWARRILQNCVPPLARAFGDDIGCFWDSAARLGGTPYSGDTAKFFVLPHLPMYVTIWERDDEFPADARILFDASLPHQLPREDILVLPELLAFSLLSLSGKPFSMPGIGEFRTQKLP